MLVGKAKQKHVGAKRIAEQYGSGARGVEEMRFLLAGGAQDRLLEPFNRQREIGGAGKIARHHFSGVGEEESMAFANRTQHLAGAGHDEIATENEVRLA